MRDRFSTVGNNNATAINFTYSKNLALGEQLLQTVRYNNGQIKLIYEARPANDQILKFDDGIQLGFTNSRVSKIEIYDEPVVNSARQLRLFKQYNLAYIQSQATKRSLITNVQECAASPSSTCLPASSFTYRQFDVAQVVSIGYATNTGWRPAHVVDQNGKGKQTIASNPLIGYRAYTPTPLPSLAWDINGDGVTDYYFADTSEGVVEANPRPFESEWISGINQEMVIPGRYYNSRLLATACYADLNGDGVSERISYLYEYAYSSIWGSYFLNTIRLVEEGVSDVIPLGSIEVTVVSPEELIECSSLDVDGDGRSELMVKYPAPSPSDGPIGYSILEPDGFRTGQKSPLILGDFNGDGKTDGVFDRFQGFILSDGRNLAQNTLRPLPAPSLDYYNTQYCAGDFNGDGRTDLLINTNYPYSILTFLLSVGNTFERKTLPGYFAGKLLCGDFNGDGLTDFTNDGQIIANASPGPADVMLLTNNGLGQQHLVEYKSITDDSVYTKYSGAVRPQVDIQNPVSVVSRAQSGNDVQGWSATQYRYEGLRADLHRRGTLGFAKVISTNETTQISIATSYHQSWPLTGMKSRMIKSRVGATLEDTSYSYGRRGYNSTVPPAVTGTHIHQIHLTQNSTQRKDLSGAFLGQETESTPPGQYDTYGSPLSNTKVQLDAAGVLTSRITTTNVYDHNTQNWVIGQLKSSSSRSENLRTLPSTQVGGAERAGSQVGQ